MNPGTPPLIRLENVSKSFPTTAGQVPALQDIDLAIPQGQFISIIGKSGSGKSTLINMITGIDRPTSGRVIVGERVLGKMGEGNLSVWRGRNMGVVFQFFQLLPVLTLLENVLLPMDLCGSIDPLQRESRARDLLAQVGLAGYADKYPGELSGGQQQSAAIARSLANDPPIIVADEPTGNLDSATAESVYKIFEGLVAEGKTIVMVTHDAGLASRAQRTIIISDGHLVNESIAAALPKLFHPLMMQLSNLAKMVTFEPGGTVYTTGQPGPALWIVTAGEAQTWRNPGRKGEKLLDTYSAGALITSNLIEPGNSLRAGSGFEALFIAPESLAPLLKESAAMQDLFHQPSMQGPAGKARHKRRFLWW